jgi:catechol 2,3-dioxygenase-like lactoylglutathione lyase family enzyme
VTFVVADLDRSLTLYRDILGFEVAEIKEATKDSYAYPVFKIDPNAKLRFATLSAGPGQERAIGFKEIKGMDLPKPALPYMTATVLRTSDIKRDFEKIEALGLDAMELRFVESTDTYHFYERAFVDFDGHVIALYEVVKQPE